MQVRIFALIFVLLVMAPALAQNASSVPREYSDLYGMLDRKVSAFDARINRGWRQLLDPRAFEGTKLELTRLQDLGVRAVTVCIGFPLLYRPFFEFNGDPDDYQRFIDFYHRLSDEVHRRNMKLIVESSILFGGVYSQGSGLQKRVPKELQGRVLSFDYLGTFGPLAISLGPMGNGYAFPHTSTSLNSAEAMA